MKARESSALFYALVAPTYTASSVVVQMYPTEIGMLMNEVRVQPAYRLKTFGEDFKIGKTKIYEEINSGRLKTYKIGRCTFIAGADAVAWQEQHRKRGARCLP